MKKIFLYLCFTLITIGVFLMGGRLVEVQADSYPFTGIITADSAVIHNAANYDNSSAVTELAYGMRVTVTGLTNSMYIINYDGGKTGYVAKTLVVNLDSNTTTSNLAGVETYAEYCGKLGTLGFPESYCPYLYYLHAKHPTWTFTPNLINKTLDEVATAELWKVGLQTANPNYWLQGSPYEGDYYYVNKDVISSFLDPRNSMFENYIFQFLNLEKNANAYNTTALRAVVSNNLLNYINTYAQAGQNEGINPLHMLVRSAQEGMDDPTYSSISGKYTSTYGRKTPEGYNLDGYYNYFNVGAWIESGYTTISRGLAHAAGFLSSADCISYNSSTGKHYYDETKCAALSDQRPWNTPEKAILGGSKFLAQKYVKSGQNTLFFQKYNISTYSNYDIFTHQYMTNAYATIGEGSRMYTGYSKGSLLGTNFEFIIPVYKNMGNVYQPVDKNSETRLNEIKINNQLITGFDKDVVEYNINVITSDNKINVTASAMAGTTTISGLGDYNFTNDQASIQIKTTAENGSTKTYYVNVKKVLPQNEVKASQVVSKLAVKVNGNSMYGISPGMNASTLINTVVKNGGSAKVYNASGAVKSTGDLATGDKIVINGTNDTLTYSIAVRGDTSGDGLIKINDLILVQSHILGTRVLNGIYFYAADTSYDLNIKINDLILIQSKILGKGNL